MKNLKKVFLVLMLFMTLCINVKALNACDTCESPIKNNFETIVDEEVNSKSDINGSAFLAGANVELSNIVDGVSFLAGANNTFSGISEYLVSASSTANLTGTINKDMVIFASDIKFSDDFIVKRDSLILGSNISVSGKFLRDVIIMGSNVNLDNVVIEGNVKIYADAINISETAIINSKLSYNENTLIENNSNSINEIEVLEVVEIEDNSNSFKTTLSSFISSTIKILATALFMVIILPSLFNKLNKINEKLDISNILKYFGYGAITFIVLPLAALILLVSSVGFSVGLILIPIYIIIVYISTIFSGYLLGNYLKTSIIKKDFNNNLYLLIGIFIICLLKVIPYIGSIIQMLSIFVGLGMITDLILKQKK